MVVIDTLNFCGAIYIIMELRCLCLCVYMSVNSSQSFECFITKLGISTLWVTGMIVGYLFIFWFSKKNYKYGHFLPVNLWKWLAQNCINDWHKTECESSLSSSLKSNAEKCLDWSFDICIHESLVSSMPNNDIYKVAGGRVFLLVRLMKCEFQTSIF